MQACRMPRGLNNWQHTVMTNDWLPVKHYDNAISSMRRVFVITTTVQSNSFADRRMREIEREIYLPQKHNIQYITIVARTSKHKIGVIFI